MTGVPTMTAFTPEAERRLDEYLRQVRAAVAGAAEVSPDEVEADLREHVAAEFARADRPVGLVELEAVLVRLGPPSQWLPAGGGAGRPVKEVLAGRLRALRSRGATAARRFWDAVYRGPDDWRLPYLAFAVFALGVLSFFLFPLCLVVSYLLARATVALYRERGVSLGAARKWLVYPPLVLVSVPLLVATVAAVPVAVGAASADVLNAEGRHMKWRERAEAGLSAPKAPPPGPLDPLLAAVPVDDPQLAGSLLGLFAGVGALALWLTALGGVWWAFPGLPRGLYPPLFGEDAARHGRKLFAWSLFALVIWGGFAYRLTSAAGVV